MKIDRCGVEIVPRSLRCARSVLRRDDTCWSRARQTLSVKEVSHLWRYVSVGWVPSAYALG